MIEIESRIVEFRHGRRRRFLLLAPPLRPGARLARRFAERMTTQASGRRGEALNRSAFMRRLSADQIALTGLIPYLEPCVQKQ